MLAIETIHWHTLAPQFLGPHSKVLDLGANWGMFSRAITARTGCTCVAVEPSPGPFSGIPTLNGIRKLNLAVAGQSGVMRFHVDESNGLASSLTTGEGIETIVVTLPQLLDQLEWEKIDLLKVDIEGAEIEMLKTCSDDILRRRIAQMTIEFHDFCGITPAATVNETIARLHALGFKSIRMSRIGHQDTWFLNTNLLSVNSAEFAFHRFVTRNWFGLKRVAARINGEAFNRNF